jgi:hypothetical protein
MKLARTWATPSALRKAWDDFNWRFWQDDGMRKQEELADAKDLDPHYRVMLKYPDASNWWYFIVLVISVVIGLVVIYKADSTLPWWGFFISMALGAISILFFGALYAITGLQFIIQPFVQMIGGFIHPGKPMANMYFVLYSYSKVLSHPSRSCRVRN